MEKRSEEENTTNNKERSSINNYVSSMEKGEGQIDEPRKTQSNCHGLVGKKEHSRPNIYLTYAQIYTDEPVPVVEGTLGWVAW